MLFEMLKKVDEKLDAHTDSLARLEVQVCINTKDLAEHIRRSDLIEEKIELDKKSIESRLEVLEQPGLVTKFLQNKLVKFCGITSALYGLIQFIKYLKAVI